MAKISMTGINYLCSRMVDPSTAEKCGIYTVDDPREPAMAFPFIENGKVVGIKYRALNSKKFWQEKGSKQIFWNHDAVKRAATGASRMLVITEGEFDCMAAIDAGFEAVSVPNGAPSPTGKPVELDPARERDGKFAFLGSCARDLKNIDGFILAVDNDPSGEQLRDELVARLSASRCYVVEYPEGCKDLSDVAQHLGASVVKDVLDNARALPVRGVFTLSDYPDKAPPEPVRTQWNSAHAHFLPFPGEFAVITGVPSSGKSTFALNLLVGLGENQKRSNFISAIFSPEMPVKPYLERKLCRLYAGDQIPKGTHPGEFDRWFSSTGDIRRRVVETINQRHVFIDRDPAMPDDELSMDWVLDRATEAVQRHGIRALLIDPWNELEHARRRNEAITDYVGRSIRSIKAWAQQYGVMVFVVAHPTKAAGEGGVVRRKVTLYDIEGSAHWYNKCDHGLVVYRPVDQDAQIIAGRINISVEKSRFEECGEAGLVLLAYTQESGRIIDP